MREAEGLLEHKCAFCREAAPDIDEECNAQLMKRIEANDPGAMCCMGTNKYEEGDYKAAFDYWTRAVALGDVEVASSIPSFCASQQLLPPEEDALKR